MAKDVYNFGLRDDYDQIKQECINILYQKEQIHARRGTLDDRLEEIKVFRQAAPRHIHFCDEYGGMFLYVYSPRDAERQLRHATNIYDRTIPQNQM